MAKDQLKAYQGAQQKNMTPREAEAMAFTKAAAMMEDAKRNPGDETLLAQALRFNQLFWTILQADIADPNNGLPNELKANIMSLSIFVDKQVARAFRSGKPEDLDALISINRNLAMGLRETPGGETTEPPRQDSSPSSGSGAMV